MPSHKALAVGNLIPSAWSPLMTLQWRHNGRDSVSNHQPHDCLLNLLYRRRSKKTSILVILTRKMFPFDDVIMTNKDLQGSTLTVVRLGIPSSFCCRTTWTYVYGCPLVKLRKLINWILLDRTFINDWVKQKLRSESIKTCDLQCTRSCKFYLFHLCSKENKESLTGYTRPFNVRLGCSWTAWEVFSWSIIWRHASSHNVVRGWPTAQKSTLCGWCASGRW